MGKLYFSLWISCSSLLIGCSVGLTGGSIEKTFSGVSDVTILGPETVEISWENSSSCNSYKIFQLSTSTTSDVGTATISPARLTAPIIQSDRTYTFAVGCVESDRTTGLGTQKTISTWPQFDGRVNSTLDTTGQNPLVVLNWTPPTSSPIMFQIYAQLSSVPGDLSAWQLTSTGAGSGYSETPLCSVFGTSARIGTGGDCSTSSLQAGQIYNFKVVARYLDNTFSTDVRGTGTSILIPASFNPPNCFLTKSGLGADATTSYLFLRCDAGTSSGSCLLSNMSIRAFQAVNGVRTAVSDTLVGAGTLRIEPRISSTQANDRVIENLEIEYTCNSVSPATKAIIRYDGNLVAYPKPSLKYADTGYEKAPKQSIEQSPSYAGSAMTTGDFNCDGKPDLALGFPNVTFAQSPYFSRASQSGLVRVYYGFSRAADGTVTSSESQVLSFRDLPNFANFGKSLSAGNVNRDVFIDPNTSEIYSCDDLIIGAPGNEQIGSEVGAAYVFYGHPQKFAQPLDSGGLAVNAPTCSGTISNQICSPVKLVPNQQQFFYVDPTHGQDLSTGAVGSYFRQFGFSVAYLRDFNADGFGDIGIGDPYCDWDGEAVNGQGYLVDPSLNNKVRDVGCVYIYWGGPNGLQNVQVGRTPNGSANLIAPYVKVYPPIPQQGMHFGWSIGAGGDVDADLPVPNKQNGTNDIILASGHDFVVGAPDFNYSQTSVNWAASGRGTIPTWTLSGGDSVDPIVTQGETSFDPAGVTAPSNKITPPWNGAWARPTGGSNPWTGALGFPLPSSTALRNSTGIAFLYRGRAPHVAYDVQIKAGFKRLPLINTTDPLTTPLEDLLSDNVQSRRNGSPFIEFPGIINWQLSPVESFYNCGNRGAPTGASPSGLFKHVSCLAGRNNFSVLYPILRSGDSPVTQFGKNVGVAGTAEENALALYQLGINTVAKNAYSVNTATGLLSAYSQKSTHSSIRGMPLWEVGIPDINTSTATCALVTSSTAWTEGAACTARIARAPIREQYNFSFAFTGISTQPDWQIPLDINRDGYADVGVTSGGATTAALYTFFGNHAADFSYSRTNLGADTYGTGGACNVTRNSTGVAAANVDSTGRFSNRTLMTHPFTTFYSKLSATKIGTNPSINFITNEFPVSQVPLISGHYVASTAIEDMTSTSGSASIDYSYRDVARTTNFASNCFVQRRDYGVEPSALAFSDLNADMVIDGIVGFASDNSSQGKTHIVFSASGGGGLISDAPFTNGTGPKSLGGTSVLGLSWRFMNETVRRDLLMGAPGFDSGAGIVLNYNASGTNSIGPIPAGSFTEDSSAPNVLMANQSRSIGDLNGDGYDDIWVPVKRISEDGTTNYNAIVYFGSAFGPITTTRCLERIVHYKTNSGTALSASSCEAATNSETALIGSTLVRLPQYITKPSTIGRTWALNAFASGDIDGDGKGDVTVIDNHIYAIHTFFGSDSGLVNGQPVLGPSNNHSPQKVTGSSSIISGYYPAPLSSYSFNFSVPGVMAPGGIGSAYNFSHGDFNGDGYEDIVISNHGGSSPELTGAWSCSTASRNNPSYLGQCGSTTPVVPAMNPGPEIQGAGYLVVLYGGPSGIQTPVNGAGVPVDFESIEANCNDFYGTCNYVSTSSTSLNHYSETYRSLRYNSGGGVYEIDTNRTACDPATNSCKASLIRSPLFFNDTSGQDSFLNLGLNFGSVNTVADVNHDGIDDLVVGWPHFFHPNYSSARTTAYQNGTILGSTAADSLRKGSIMVFYGSKGAGIVAPSPQEYLTDQGLGVSGPTVVPAQSRSIFTLYPHPADIGQPASVPELDRTAGGAPLEANRQFGISLAAGDFDGNGADDLATVSGHGQLYVYYGPLCQVDNARLALWNNTYFQHNIARTVSGYTPNDCTVINLNQNLSSASINSLGAASAITKNLFPQMVYVSGTLNTDYFGHTLMAQRPKRQIASTTQISNPGNINGDPERTSDLIIGSPVMQDPNATLLSFKRTGLGYVFFGHKSPVAGDMSTTPGLYIGNASYNSSIISQLVSGTTYFYYSPMLLRPHTPDSSIGRFFLDYSSAGDFNGDGRMDLVLPSQDIHEAIDGTPVVNGGGFKLVY